MDPERPKPKIEMDQAERDLWKMVDIYGFGGKMGTIVRAYPEYIRLWLVHGKTEKAEENLHQLEEVCRQLRERIKQIDISKLDARFPLGPLQRLVEDAPRALEETAQSTRAAFERGRLSNDAVQEIKSKTDFIMDIAEELGRDERYYEYRTRTREQDRE